MVVSINIDETIRKPNVRPPAPRSKRGPITFIAEIEESNGRNLRRNLTRGVNRTDDLPTSTPIPGDRTAALEALLLYLSVSSEFEFPRVASLEDITISLTLPDITVLGGETLNLSAISVDLINLMELNGGLAVVDDEFLGLTLPELGVAIPTDQSLALSSVDINLTIPKVMVLTTGSQRRDINTIVTEISTREVGVAIVLNSDVSSSFTNEVQLQTGFNTDSISIAIDVEEFEIEVAGDIDTPAISLTVSEIEVEQTGGVKRPAGNISLELSVDAVFDQTGGVRRPAGNISLELSVDAVFDTSEEKGLGPVELRLGVGSLTAEVGGNVTPIPVGAQLVEFQLESRANFAPAEIDLDAVFIVVEVGGVIDPVDMDLTLDINSDTELNIQLPANMESAQDDDATTVT